MEYDFVQYENKVGITKRIHLLNFHGGNNFESVQNPSHKDHLPINVACIGISAWRNQKKAQNLSLTRNLQGKMWSNHLIQSVMWWELRWCQRTWMWEKMVSKRKLPKSIPLHAQVLNYETNIYELEDHVGGKGLNLNQSTKFKPTKRTPPTSFPNHMLKSIWIKSTILYA